MSAVFDESQFEVVNHEPLFDTSKFDVVGPSAPDSGGYAGALTGSDPTQKLDPNLEQAMAPADLPNLPENAGNAVLKKTGSPALAAAVHTIASIPAAIPAVLETLSGMAGSFASAVPATVAGAVTSAVRAQAAEQTGEDPGAAAGQQYTQTFGDVQQAISDKLQLAPQTELGKQFSSGIDQAFSYLPEKAGEAAERFGPGAATAAKTAAYAAELAGPFLLGKRAAIPKESDKPAPTVTDITEPAGYEVVKPSEAPPSAPKSDVTNSLVSGEAQPPAETFEQFQARTKAAAAAKVQDAGLVVALKDKNGDVEVGKPGEIHAQLLPRLEDAEGFQAGYVDKDGKFYTRAEAQREFRISDAKELPPDIAYARDQAQKTFEGVFERRSEPRIGEAEAMKHARETRLAAERVGTGTFYSGLPVEDMVNTVKLANEALMDRLGKPEPGVTVNTPPKEPMLTPLDFLKSPRVVEQKFPKLARTKALADRARVVQDTVRDAFARRLKVIDDSLGSRITGRSEYRANKAKLREILLTEDMLGKRLGVDEMRTFDPSPKVMTAYRMTRSVLDRAHGILTSAREARGKEAPGYREGYVPHFFHDFTVRVAGKTVASARNQVKATMIANKLARSGEKNVTVTPRQFNFPGGDMQAVIVGDSKYFKLKQGIEEAFSLTPEQSDAIVGDLLRQRGRSRFLGNLMQRKGVEGWDKNLDYAIPHYLNMVARYAAMDRFKSKAISLFENPKSGYGEFDKEYTGIAKYTKDYINDVMGVPTRIESMLNSLLKDNPVMNQILGKYLGSRPSLQLAGALNKAVTVASFGFANVSAALVNLFQLQMGYSLLGAKWTGVGLARTAPIAKAIAERKLGLNSKAQSDIGVLRQLGVDVAQGLESGSGYSKFSGMGKLLGSTLFLWKGAEWTNRAAVGLGAYYRGLSLGMSKAEAIGYAKTINDRVNFDYSVQDAPALFRRSGPPGSMLLQFKKFPLKSVEFIKELKGIENARFWVPMITMAGLYGMPGIEGVKNLLHSLFGMDIELETKKSLMNWAGEDAAKQAVAKTIFYGAFANKELGGVDLSRRLGTGDFIPSSVPDFMGPFFSKAVRAVQLTSQGDVAEAFRTVSPGLGNPILAARSENVTSPSQRDRLVTKIDPGERALKATGFRTATEAVETDKARVINYETQKYAADMRDAIDSLLKANSSGDKEALAKAKARVEKLQIAITEQGINREAVQKLLTSSQRAYLNAPDLVKGETAGVFKFK